MFNRHVCLIKSGGGQGSPHNTLVSVLGGKSIHFNGAPLVSHNTTYCDASQKLSAGRNRQKLSPLKSFWVDVVCTDIFFKQHVSYYTLGRIVLEKNFLKKKQRSVGRFFLY